MYIVSWVLRSINNIGVEMTPAFCAALRAAAERNRFAVTIVTLLDESGKLVTVRTNGYWFAPL